LKLILFQVLGDIEIAQGIERDKEKKQKEVNIITFSPSPSRYYDDIIKFTGWW
jgi:hypothetical protein